jgi:hypothetical protein
MLTTGIPMFEAGIDGTLFWNSPPTCSKHADSPFQKSIWHVKRIYYFKRDYFIVNTQINLHITSYLHIIRYNETRIWHTLIIMKLI